MARQVDDVAHHAVVPLERRRSGRDPGTAAWSAAQSGTSRPLRAASWRARVAAPAVWSRCRWVTSTPIGRTPSPQVDEQLGEMLGVPGAGVDHPDLVLVAQHVADGPGEGHGPGVVRGDGEQLDRARLRVPQGIVLGHGVSFRLSARRPAAPQRPGRPMRAPRAGPARPGNPAGARRRRRRCGRVGHIAEDRAQQFAGPVDHGGLRRELRVGGDVAGDLDDAHHLVEIADQGLDGGEGVEAADRSELGGPLLESDSAPTLPVAGRDPSTKGSWPGEAWTAEPTATAGT